MQIRFQFNRGNDLKFIGHLDILRLFERTFKRSGLPVAHSQGFNPRPQIIFGQPMPLGLTSEGEFADVELLEELDPQRFLEIMNSSLPPGIQLLNAKVKRNPSNLMAQILGAKYHVSFKASEDLNVQELISSILRADTILVMKKSKSGEKETNIRLHIHQLTGSFNGTEGYFDVLLGAGQVDNIRPDLFVAGVSSAFQAGLELTSMHRVMLLGRKENTWISLLDEQML